MSTAIRTALGEAFIGDTAALKALFANPTTVDARLIEMMTGLAIRTDDATADDLAMLANLRAFMKRISSTNQAERISFVDSLRTIIEEVPPTPLYSIFTNSGPGNGIVHLLDLDASGTGTFDAYTDGYHWIRCSASADRREFHLTAIANFPIWAVIPPEHRIAWLLPCGNGALFELMAKLPAIGAGSYSFPSVPSGYGAAAYVPNFKMEHKNGSGEYPGTELTDWIQIDAIPSAYLADPHSPHINLHLDCHLIFPE